MRVTAATPAFSIETLLSRVPAGIIVIDISTPIVLTTNS
jgi:hypothetical protein